MIFDVISALSHVSHFTSLTHNTHIHIWILRIDSCERFFCVLLFLFCQLSCCCIVPQCKHYQAIFSYFYSAKKYEKRKVFISVRTSARARTASFAVPEVSQFPHLARFIPFRARVSGVLRALRASCICWRSHFHSAVARLHGVDVIFTFSKCASHRRESKRSARNRKISYVGG